MPSKSIPQPEMEALVRRVLDGADLSKTTGAIVREKVRGILGERADEVRAFKRSVRVALAAVMSDAAPERPSVEAEDRAEGKGTSGIGQDDLDGDGNADTKVDFSRRGGGKPEDLAYAEVAVDEIDNREGSDEQASQGGAEEDDDFVSGGDARKAPPAVFKKNRKRAVIEEDDSDGSAYPAKEDYTRERLDSTEDIAKPRARVPSNRSPEALRPVKRSRSHLFTTEKQLERLRSVCKQLGCMVPPARMRGKSVAEKCTAVIDFLAQKGVHAPNPTTLTKKELLAHRARLEQEKELAGLDSGNIITDTGRSRRSRGLVLAEKQDVDLPSDYSGPALSESSDEEEEEEDYNADSSEAE